MTSVLIDCSFLNIQYFAYYYFFLYFSRLSVFGNLMCTVVFFGIMLQLNSDGQNEFVKSYLQQREQLMSQQMEQKKRYEGADCWMPDCWIHLLNIITESSC